MPIAHDVTGLAAEAGVSSTSLDAPWKKVAADSHIEMQNAFLATAADRVSSPETGTLEVFSLDGSSKSLTPPTRQFDPRQSATDLAAKGVFIDQTPEGAGDNSGRNRPISNITVEPLNKLDSSEIDFIVKANGKIVMLKNPDTSDASKIVIGVEGNDVPISAAQQKAIDGTITYLAERLMKSTADGERTGSLMDEAHIASPDLEKGLGLTAPEKANSENFAPGDGHSNDSGSSAGGGGSSGDGGFSGGGGSPGDGGFSGGGGSSGDGGFSGGGGSSGDGGFSGGGGSSGDASVEPGRELSEADLNAVVKNVVAFMNDATSPQRYELVSQTSKNEYEIGPYAIGYDKIVDWLQALLGNPPDLSKLDELVKKGLLSKEEVEQIKSKGFEKFVKGLKDGNMPTEKQVKTFLPKDVQEQIADHMINSFSNQFKTSNAADVDKIALSLELGHAATEKDMTNNRSFLDTAAERSGIYLNDASSSSSVDTNKLSSIFFTQFAHPDWNPYGDAPSSSSNCGPASLSMVLRMLGVGPSGVDLYGDPNPLVSQVKIMMTGTADPSVTTDVGEAATAAQQLGLTSEPVGSLEQINQALNQGKKIVLGGNPIAYNQGFTADQYATHPNGDGTSSIFVGGHIIAIGGISDNGDYIVLDPAYKEGILTLTPDQLLGFMAPDGDYAGIAVGNP